MNLASALLTHPWLVALGWIVVLSLWTTTLPALALAVWRLRRPSARASAEYRAAVIALAAALLLSLASLPLLVLNGTVMPGPTPAVQAASSPSRVLIVEALPSSPRHVGGALLLNRDAGPGTAWEPSSRALGAAGLAWIVGASVMLGRLLFGWRAATRLGRRSTLMDEGAVRATFERLSERVHVTGVRLAVSGEIDAPVAVGIRAPAVLIPPHLLEYMPDDGLAPILAHELAHVARRDYAAHLVESAVEALLFHSPATWWIGRRIREAREFCCDDVSVDVAGDRARYVEALTLVARLGAAPHTRPAVGMAGPRLITRVRRLLEGEPTMSMPLARVLLAVAGGVVAVVTLPSTFTIASRHVSAELLAAGAAVQQGDVPFGFAPRQDGSALRVLRVTPADGRVCGTFEVQNEATVAIDRVRFIGILSFSTTANRPVQIVESDWLSQPIAPGATVLLDARLIDEDAARREAQGQHVQAFCAVREIAYGNGGTWSVTPNASAIRHTDVLDQTRPTLPRAFVGQTHVLAAPRTSLCLDDEGDKYSPGAQIEIRAEPGSAARCATDGQWVEVDARSGVPLVQVASATYVVTLDVLVDGMSSPIVLKSASGSVATVQVPGGRTWGLVPTMTANGVVHVTLHDMSATPHRLVGARTLQSGATARFDDALPVVSVRLGSH